MAMISAIRAFFTLVVAFLAYHIFVLHARVTSSFSSQPNSVIDDSLLHFTNLLGAETTTAKMMTEEERAISAVTKEARFVLEDPDGTIASYRKRHESNASIPAGEEHAVARSPYAYAFVIGGCDPGNPGYKGFLYNILVSAHILKEVGSKADVVAFFQLGFESNWTTLPDEEVQYLTRMGVRVLYIPKSHKEGFYETVMNKFRILSLTEYRRVLLLDGDVIPNDNLDYLFAFSDGKDPIFKENVVVAGPWEPANAGFFMVQPQQGYWERIQQIVHTREVKAMNLTPSHGYKFDKVDGWGHVIEPPDQWVSRKENGTHWDFHFAFSDQGLLYHWVKYERKSFSAVYQYEVENWSSYPNGTVRLESKVNKPFRDVSRPLVYLFAQCAKFMCGFIHFTGKSKPWLRQPMINLTETDRLRDKFTLWWSTLQRVNEELGMNMDFVNWTANKRPSFGLFATLSEMGNRMDKTYNTAS